MDFRFIISFFCAQNAGWAALFERRPICSHALAALYGQSSTTWKVLVSGLMFVLKSE